MNSEKIEPPETKYKPYLVTCDISGKINLVVWRKSSDEAKEYILNNNTYSLEEELIDYKIEDIEKIEEIKEINEE